MAGIAWLDPTELTFPDTAAALVDPNGLLAAGGDLTAERLIEAYKRGIFPWYEAGQPILWWSPNPRTVITPDEVTVSRSMRKVLRKNTFRITADTAFADIVLGCALPREFNRGTWITDDMMTAYLELHHLGIAHSVEAWDDQDQLAGGLYGVAIGGIFFGESMVSLQPNASKAALIALCERLSAWEFLLIDCQVENDHLQSMGATSMPRETFEAILETGVTMPQTPNCWSSFFNGDLI